MMNKDQIQGALEYHDSQLDRSLDVASRALATFDSNEFKKAMIFAGAHAAVATRLAERLRNSDPRTYRDGMVSGLKMAADMCRAEYVDENSHGYTWPNQPTPATLAAEIERTAEIVAKDDTTP